jgi:hypothetical protein
LTEGQAHDGRVVANMLASLGQGDILLRDAAYDSGKTWSRAALGPASSRCPTAATCQRFSSFLYRYRNLV